MSSSDRIHVICAADARYGAYAGIMFSSILRCCKRGSIHCHLLDDGVRQDDLDRMVRMSRDAAAGFDRYDIQEMLDRYPAVLRRMAHYTRAAFGRLFISEFLPDTVQRVIYFDCDVICVSDLQDLWD